ncbi:MAG: dephospho-CoA kinase [Lachnospiraceae bacterium]|nr:dephospho-CoA kinase [Lachnospiraceae bacterium]
MIIGITGGIGTGKSTVLKILKEKYGFVVFEADKIGHELMKKGNKTYDKIVKCFGNEILDSELAIDRKALSDIVFHDNEKLNHLNKIIHPAVICEIKSEIEKYKLENKNDKFVIEAALLIESGCDKICDRVWYIYADRPVRIERLIKNRGMSEKQINAVMKNQLEKEEFIKNTDYVIDNSGRIEDTDRQIKKLLEF